MSEADTIREALAVLALRRPTQADEALAALTALERRAEQAERLVAKGDVEWRELLADFDAAQFRAEQAEAERDALETRLDMTCKGWEDSIANYEAVYQELRADIERLEKGEQ